MQLISITIAIIIASSALSAPADDNHRDSYDGHNGHNGHNIHGVSKVSTRSIINSTFSCTNPDNDCNANGRCSQDGTRCICNGGWVTHNSVYPQCNYRQISRFLPFFTQLFVGIFGVGYFTLGLNALGAGEIVLFICSCILLCVTACVGGYNNGGAGALFGSIAALGLFGGFGWWLYAVIGMGTGSIQDSNGVDTYW